MGAVDLWLGPAGSGKTTQALDVLRGELDRDWQGVRYLVPTVGHKRSIEHLVLEQYGRHGLFGDPITTFFNFAEEVAQRAGVRGRRLTETQKHLLLKEIVSRASVAYFARAREFPGFVQALGEAIDELKVHMVDYPKLLAAADIARQRGAESFALKIRELGEIYAAYQSCVKDHDLYDNEGIMWTAAELLDRDPALFADLRCLILDGFARLTPIQADFLRVLASRAARIIVLFDHEQARPAAVYAPVLVSLERLRRVEEGGVPVRRRTLARKAGGPGAALDCLRTRVFQPRPRPCELDASVELFIAATPAQQEEMIARDVRKLLREGKLPDGASVSAADIAILARNADALRERFARTFQRYGLSIRSDPPTLAHTPLGRMLLAAFRLARDGWKREDVLSLLKSDFLAIDPAAAFRIDLVARSHYLREGRAHWLTRWPDDDTREALQTALAPLAAFDDAHRRRGVEAEAPLAALEALLAAFRAQALAERPALPDEDAAGARQQAEYAAAFRQVAAVLADLRQVSSVLGGARRGDGFGSRSSSIEEVAAALMREKMPTAPDGGEGIPVFPVHATGGAKFGVVYLCDLREGVFPLHQRESAFLMDHERDEALRDLNIALDARRRLEEDEPYWFLHAISSATRRLALVYPQHDAAGAPYERSSFLDEVEKVLPGLGARARSAPFRQVAPALEEAESLSELLGGLALGLRTQRDEAEQSRLAAAYAGCACAHGPGSLLGRIFRRAGERQAAITDQDALDGLARVGHAFSPSALQTYLDCPFLWFARHALRVEEIVEEFTGLDRGLILHQALEALYRARQTRPGEPVRLGDASLEELWPEVEADLRARLESEPRHANRPHFLRDIEWESLRSMMRAFLAREIARAQTRQTYPALFEQEINLTLPAPDGEDPARISGRVDRIDLTDDGRQAVVVDYKTSTQGTTQADLARGLVLQAPLYVLAVEQTLRLTALGAEFMGLKQGKSVGIYREEASALYGAAAGMKRLDAADWSAFLARSAALVAELVLGIRTGKIALDPTTNLCPSRCAYCALCRGDRFQLARIVRRKRKAVPDATS